MDLYSYLRRLRRSSRPLCLLASLVCLNGCATFGGTATPVLETYQPCAEPSCERLTLTQLADADPGVATETQRDAYITREIIKIDTAHDAFVQQLQRSKTGSELGAALLNLAVDVAGTLTNSTGVQKNYAAAGVLISGTSGAVNKSLFFDKTTMALVSAMAAHRARVLTRLRQGMSQTMEAYPVVIAHHDLKQYLFASSLLGGLTFIETSAGDEKEKAEREIQKIAELTVSERHMKHCVTRSLEPENERLTEPGLRIAAGLAGHAPSSTDGREKFLNYLLTENRKDVSRTKAVYDALETAQILMSPCPEY